MRILVIPGYYGFGGRSTAGASGAGVFFRDQAVALARRGHHVILLFVHFDTERGAHVDEVDDEGVRCVYVHAAPWPKFNSLYRIVLMVRALRRLEPTERPEVIHAHVFHALPAALVIACLFRLPLVVTEHSSKVRLGIVSPGWQLVARVGYPRVKRLLAVSRPLAAALGRYTRRPVDVVPNLVREPFFDLPLPAGASGSFTFLSIGYCDPIKGWDVLLRAFALLRQDTSAARLVLCGAVCPELVSLAERLGITDRVRFVGRVPPEEIPWIVAECDCHVMPSRTETFGIASIEALAAGRPIIMTATDAAPEIVDPHNGLIVPPDDVEALAHALRSMIADAGRYDPEQIRASCRSKFSEAAVVAQLLEVYRQASAGDSLG